MYYITQKLLNISDVQYSTEEKVMLMSGNETCDMRGMLSFQILFLLSKKPMHGEELAQELAKRRGEKPTAGTIYPALKELKNKHFIVGNKDGKLIVYSLTPVGQNTYKQSIIYFQRCFGDIIVEVQRIRVEKV